MADGRAKGEKGEGREGEPEGRRPLSHSGHWSVLGVGFMQFRKAPEVNFS